MIYRASLAGIAATAAIALTATAYAHSGATGVVKERMMGMGAMKDAVKILTPMMQGEVPWDEAAVRDAARAIEDHAGKAMTELFPEGSLDKPTEALPAIWQDWDRFAALAERLERQARGLALAAGNAPEGAAEADMGAGGGMMSTGSMMGTGEMMGTGTMMGTGGQDDAGAMVGTDGMMGTGSMMGTGAMMGTGSEGGPPMPDPEMLAEMPAATVFARMTRTCSACHGAFRAE